MYHILHSCDIGSVDIITELESLAPVTAVYGNTDDMAIRAKYPRVAELRLEGFDIVVTHGDQFGREVSSEEFNQSYPTADILIHGHTHIPKLEIVDITVTVMNPGAAGARRFDIPASVGIMELEAGIPPRARLVPVSELDED